MFVILTLTSFSKGIELGYILHGSIIDGVLEFKSGLLFVWILRKQRIWDRFSGETINDIAEMLKVDGEMTFQIIRRNDTVYVKKN